MSWKVTVKAGLETGNLTNFIIHIDFWLLNNLYTTHTTLLYTSPHNFVNWSSSGV